VSLQVSFEGPSTSSTTWWGLREFQLFTRKSSSGYFNLTYGVVPLPVYLRNNASEKEVSTALAKANGLETSDYRVHRQCDLYGYCNWTVRFISGNSFEPLSMSILDSQGSKRSMHLNPVVDDNVGKGASLFVGEKEIYVSANWAANEEKDFLLNASDNIHMATVTALRWMWLFITLVDTVTAKQFNLIPLTLYQRMVWGFICATGKILHSRKCGYRHKRTGLLSTKYIFTRSHTMTRT
jgi:hypothetical protein